MLFNLTRIGNITFIEDVMDSLRAYADNNKDNTMKWEPSLNDQDIFNVFFKTNSSMLRMLPCEWNVQFHARLNTIIQCIDYTENSDYRFSSIPKNCGNTVNKNIFVCDKQPKILHFMAQSYKDYDFFEYYSSFWSDYKSLSWTDII